MADTSKRTRYFLRYLAAFCVPVLCITTLLLFFDYRNQILATQSRGIGQLQQMAANIDYLETKIHSTTLHMSGNDRLTSLDTTSFDPATYTSNRIFGLLHSYENNLPSGVTMLYYLRGGQYIYSNEKFFSYNDFIASSDYEAALGRADLYLMLNSVQEKTLIGLDSYDGSEAYCTALYCPIPEIDDAPEATVCFLLRDAFFQDVVEQYFPRMEACAVVTDGHQLVFNGAASLYTAEQAVELLEKNPGSGVMRLAVSEKPFIFLRERSANSDYNYGVLIPEEIFFQNTEQKFGLLSLLVCVMLLFSIAAAMFLAYSHYISVYRANERIDSVSEELGARNQLIREMVLRRLVKGTIENDDEAVLAYNLRCAGLDFAHPYFAVFVCDWKDLTLSEDAITNAIGALNRLRNDCVAMYPAQIPEDDRLAVILNFRQAEQDQNAIAAEICAALKEQGIAGYAAGMGLVYGSPFQIDDSYVEALVAISEAMPLLPCGAHIFSTAEKLDEQSYQYPYAEYALIEQSIRNGNSGVAVDAIRHVVERIDKIGASPLIRKCLHFDLINMIIKVAATSRHPLSNAEIAQLSSWESKDALTQQLEGILRRLAEQAKSENAESQKSAKFALIDYVQTNFRDNALTLETLATHFNLSYTYVSKVFKEETGHTFLSYLTQLRFQYIKKQLESTDTPIKEIAAAAGYNDLTNFMRKFKNAEGITPGQYRTGHQA